MHSQMLVRTFAASFAVQNDFFPYTNETLGWCLILKSHKSKTYLVVATPKGKRKISYDQHHKGHLLNLDISQWGTFRVWLLALQSQSQQPPHCDLKQGGTGSIFVRRNCFSAQPQYFIKSSLQQIFHVVTSAVPSSWYPHVKRPYPFEVTWWSTDNG